MFYHFAVACSKCEIRASLTDFLYDASGAIKIKSYCTQCGTHFENLFEPDHFKDLAYHRDNPFPSPKDLEFLKQLNIIWGKQLPPPK